MTPPPSSLREEIRRLERLREEDPGGLAFARLAEAYRAAGRYELALEVLDEGIENAPAHPAGHLVMARVHHDLRDARRERRALERALEVDPGNSVALRALSELEEEGQPPESDADRPGEALDEPEERRGAEGPRRASHSPEERRELLEQLNRVSRADWWDQASEEVGDGGQPDDDGAVVTETMGRLYARQGLWEEAESVYRRLCQARPDEGRLARCLERVREQEVPDRPPRSEPEPPGTSRESGATAPRERPLSAGGGELDGTDAPTMRAHLRDLLRGRAREESASRDESASSADGGDGGAGEGSGERDPAMDELLQRWRSAARKGETG